jgi:hypothetical protein
MEMLIAVTQCLIEKMRVDNASAMRVVLEADHVPIALGGLPEATRGGK